MVSDELEQLREELARLRAELALREQEAQQRAQQLKQYAEERRMASERERMRAQELRRSYDATVRALADAVEARDAYTGKHAERVAAYGVVLARVCGLDVSANPQVEVGFLLHDGGKVAVPDSILFKPEPLTT